MKSRHGLGDHHPGLESPMHLESATRGRWLGSHGKTTEDVQREAMHPADQFEAFAVLVIEGRPVEDIAVDFDVTPLVVERRMRLASVSPRLLGITGPLPSPWLNRLALTDDHEAREAAFYDAWYEKWRSVRVRRSRGTECHTDADGS
jgi:ParB family transcriptional regulator, chromosome partitioning protein